MSDKRRSIKTRIWSDEWVEKLSPQEKLLWIYLLTNSHSNMLGLYEITIRKISFETGLTQEMVSKALKGFERIGKAFLFFDKFLFLPNWIKNQAMNSNMNTSARNLWDELPNELIIKLKENGFESFESLSNPLKGLGNPSQNKKDESEIEKERGKGSGKPKAFTPPTIQEVCEYFKENGYSEQSAKRAFQYYESAKWIDSKGSPVKNWKQKMIGVWFKEENKTNPQSNGSQISKFATGIQSRPFVQEGDE